MSPISHFPFFSSSHGDLRLSWQSTRVDAPCHHATAFNLLSSAFRCPRGRARSRECFGRETMRRIAHGRREKRETIACNLIQRTSERTKQMEEEAGMSSKGTNERESQSDRDRKDKKLSRKTIADVVPHEWPRAEIHSNMRLVRHPLELPKTVIVKDFPPCN